MINFRFNKEYLEYYATAEPGSQGWLRRLDINLNLRSEFEKNFSAVRSSLCCGRYIDVLGDQLGFSMVYDFALGRFLNRSITPLDPDSGKPEYTCSGLISQTLMSSGVLSFFHPHDSYEPASFAPKVAHQTNLTIWIDDYLLSPFRYSPTLDLFWGVISSSNID